MTNVRASLNVRDGTIDLEGPETFVSRYLDQFTGLVVNAASQTTSSNMRSRPDSAGEAQSSAQEPRRRQPARRTGPSIRERIELLASEDFFKEQRTSGQIRDALATKGFVYATNQVAAALTTMTKSGSLRRTGSKKKWHYVNP